MPKPRFVICNDGYMNAQPTDNSIAMHTIFILLQDVPSSSLLFCNRNSPRTRNGSSGLKKSTISIPPHLFEPPYVLVSRQPLQPLQQNSCNFLIQVSPRRSSMRGGFRRHRRYNLSRTIHMPCRCCGSLGLSWCIGGHRGVLRGKRDLTLEPGQFIGTLI